MIDLALVKRAVAITMHAPEDFALQIVNTGKDGVRTRRIVSPIRLELPRIVTEHRLVLVQLMFDQASPQSRFGQQSSMILVHDLPAIELQLPLKFVVEIQRVGNRCRNPPQPGD